MLSGKESGETQEVEEGLARVTLTPEKLITHPLQNSWTLWFFKVCPLHLHLHLHLQIVRYPLTRTFWIFGLNYCFRSDRIGRRA